MVTFATVALNAGNWVSWLILGGLAGWITGRLMGGGFGFFGDIAVGIIGALVGGWVAGLVFDASFGFFGTLVVAVIGAVVVVAIYRAITGAGRTTV